MSNDKNIITCPECKGKKRWTMYYEKIGDMAAPYPKYCENGEFACDTCKGKGRVRKIVEMFGGTKYLPLNE